MTNQEWPASQGSLPEPRVQGSRKEKKGAGLPWFPDFAALEGQGVGVHLLALASSKLGLIAALGSVTLGSAAVGVSIHGEDGARHAASPPRLSEQLRDAVNQGSAGMGALAGGPKAAYDGMAYVTGAAREGALPSQAAGPAAATADGAKDAAAGADGARDADGSRNASGAAAADGALAAVTAAMGGAGAPATVGARPAFERVPSFANSGGFFGVGAGAGFASGAGRGNAAAMREGVDAAVRQGSLASARDRLLPTNRRTSALGASRAMNDLLAMAPSGQANRNAAAEAASAASQRGFDTSGTVGAALAPATAGGPNAATESASPSLPLAGESGPTAAGTGFGPPTASAVPDIPAFKNVTPYQWAVDAAKALLAVALLLGAILAICSLSSTVMLTLKPYVAMIAKALAAVGFAIAGLGAAMLGFGQMIQGGVYTAIGLSIAFTALKAVTGGGKDAAELKVSTLASAISTVAPLGGLLGADTLNHLDHPVDAAGNNQAAVEAYKKKYGIDPVTNQVIDPAKFDAKYGAGAADTWNVQHQDLST